MPTQKSVPESRAAPTKSKPDKSRSIIRAAANCFADKGFRATSIDDIAARARVGRRTVYHYFTSKEDILRAAFEQNSSDFIEKLQKQVNPDLPFPEFVVESVMFIIEHSPKEPLYSLNINEELGMESLSHYFASETAARRWIDVFQPGYIRALRSRSINPDMHLMEIIEWVGRLSLSFIQHPRISHTSLQEIRDSVEHCFGNALRFNAHS